MDRRRGAGRAKRPAHATGSEAADALLLRVLDEDFRRARERAGRWLACRPGCAECCHGPFPITRLDVGRLRRGFGELAAVDPAAAGRLRRRAREAVQALRPGYPGDPRSGRLCDDESRLDRFFDGHGGLPCPALDPATQRCLLYLHRPVACRTYGPPLRFGGEGAPACRLCFDGAPEQEIERCRIEPDRGGVEETLLFRLGVTPGAEWETLIAFALLEPGSV